MMVERDGSHVRASGGGQIVVDRQRRRIGGLAKGGCWQDYSVIRRGTAAGRIRRERGAGFQPVAEGPAIQLRILAVTASAPAESRRVTLGGALEMEAGRKEQAAEGGGGPSRHGLALGELTQMNLGWAGGVEP